MKPLGLLVGYLAQSTRRRSMRLLVALLGVFAGCVVLYSVLFHWFMSREGQRHSWPTSFYWTFVTMTTVGFGDITFTGDLGRVFSIVVLLSGSVFLLVLLPFVFIQFVFIPWMNLREAQRAPRQLPTAANGHLVLTSLGPIEDELIAHADIVGVPYVLLVGDLEEALALHDRGYRVMVGPLDSPDTYRAARVDAAALVAVTRSDVANTNITFTVREVSPSVPIVATAVVPTAVDILTLAGADDVLKLGEMLGQSMAERLIGPAGRAHVMGHFAGLNIAEAAVVHERLIGRSLGELVLRAELGIGIIGVWHRGEFEVPAADTVLDASTVLLLACTDEQLAAYNRAFELPGTEAQGVVIVGGGRVGRAAGAAFAAAGRRYRIIERDAARIRDPEVYVHGDAGDIDVLAAAGFDDAAAVLITTHDDDINVYLTIFCRRLREDLRVVSRAIVDRNVSTLYRAGADEVLSYASTGATAIWNRMRADDTVVIAEGLRVFRRSIPAELEGKSLAASHLRRRTGCNVVAVEVGGELRANPAPEDPLPAGGSLVLIGDAADEARFAEEFPERRLADWTRRLRG